MSDTRLNRLISQGTTTLNQVTSTLKTFQAFLKVGKILMERAVEKDKEEEKYR